MSDRPALWGSAVRTRESFTLRVMRAAKPPLLWTWEIHGESGKGDARRSLRGYRSAEEAWTAGRAVLADLGARGGSPAR